MLVFHIEDFLLRHVIQCLVSSSVIQYHHPAAATSCQVRDYVSNSQVCQVYFLNLPASHWKPFYPSRPEFLKSKRQVLI